jgi:hypothetical protein
MPAGVHNGESVQGDKRTRIIEAIAHGESQQSISRRLHHSENTIAAIHAAEWQKVENRKSILAAQAEAISNEAGDQLLEALHQRKIPPSQLYQNWGTALDKTMLLRGDSLSTIRHVHSFDLSEDDLVAFALQRSKQLDAEKRTKAAVVQVPALPDAEHAPSANTRNRNPRKH